MRDYDDYQDDSVRLYTPVFQRVIILTAVIIAVPVVMWTITSFVRSYVARPKVPALEHVASTTASVPIVAAATAPPSAARSSQAAPISQTAPRTDQAAASEPPNPPPADLKKSTLALAALPDSPTASVASAASAAASNPTPLQPVPVQASALASAAPAAVPAVDTANPPTASLPRSSTAPRSTDNAASSTATSSADRAIAWPNPNSASPPSFTGSRLTPSPAPPPARVAAVEAVPAAEPILGRVPLPRQRPGHIAMASDGAMPRSVPLPHARPVAPSAETTANFETPAGGRAELENAH